MSARFGVGNAPLEEYILSGGVSDSDYSDLEDDDNVDAEVDDNVDAKVDAAEVDGTVSEP